MTPQGWCGGMCGEKLAQPVSVRRVSRYTTSHLILALFGSRHQCHALPPPCLVAVSHCPVVQSLDRGSSVFSSSFLCQEAMNLPAPFGTPWCHGILSPSFAAVVHPSLSIPTASRSSSWRPIQRCAHRPPPSPFPTREPNIFRFEGRPSDCLTNPPAKCSRRCRTMALPPWHQTILRAWTIGSTPAAIPDNL